MLEPISGIADDHRYYNSLRGIYLVYGYEKETKYFSGYDEKDSGGADGAAHDHGTILASLEIIPVLSKIETSCTNTNSGYGGG
jgi:hypothetical protein